MQQAFSSVRNRLTFCFAGSSVVVLLAFSATVYGLVSTWMTEELDRGLERDLTQFTLRLATGVEPGEALPQDFGIALIAVWRGDERVAATPSWDRAGLDRAVAESARDRFFFDATDGPVYRIRRGFVGGGDMIAAARSATSYELARERLFLVLAAVTVFLIAASLAASAVLANAIARPLRSLAAQAEALDPRDPSRRLHAENPNDEIGVLGGAFNRTLDRSQAAFREMRRFTSDASHQIRTPLAAMRATGEAALASGAGAEELRETVGRLLEETDRLERLVETLLLLTRGEAGESRARLVRTDVGELARDIVGTLDVLAQERGQTIAFEAAGELFANIDGELLRQAAMNVLDNAIRHAREGGSIGVSARREGGFVALAVEDDGAGIPAADRERVFERFYRSGPPAAAVREGSGLGLAVAKWCVETCGGTIRAGESAAGGARIEIRLPAA